MTVEEKIRDILNRHYGYEVMAGTDLWFTKQYQDRFAHLLEMAEWKDEQWKDSVKKLFEKLESEGYNDRVKSGFEIFYDNLMQIKK